MKSRKEIEIEVRQFFTNKQKLAVQKLDNIIRTARANQEFNNIYIRLNELNYLIAKKKYDKIDCSLEEKEYAKLQKKQAKVLKDLNFQEQDLSIKYECSMCKDVGFVGNVPCKCFRKELSKRLLRESGVDYSSLKRLSDFNPNICKDDDKQHKQMLIKIQGFINEYITSFPKVKKEIIFLTGNTGTGKTFTAEVIAGELVRKGFYVNMVSAFQMNNMFLDYHKDFDKTNSNKLSPLLDVDLLVIDDIGAEPQFKNVTCEYLYLVISERARYHKKTIITTNLKPLEFIDRYGERIYSRIFDKSKSILLNLKGEDLRTDNSN